MSKKLAFVLGSTDHGSMIINRFDYHQVNENQSYGVGYQLLNASQFDQKEIGVILNLLKNRKESHGSGLVALDCGSNIGVYAIELAKFMNEWGSVLAFEAQERIFYALAGNIAINNCFNC